MTATRTARPKAVRKAKQRTMRVHWSATPLDTTVVSLSVTDRETDAYHVYHDRDSCEIEWRHDDDAARSYVVTWGPSDSEATGCTCRANKVNPCRHMSGSELLARLGELKLPRLTDAGHDRGTTE